MDEEIRFRREIVVKVLGWGTVVYLIVIGFALNQHSLFELNSLESYDRLHQVQISYAEALDKRSVELKEQNPVDAADLSVEATKIRVEVDQARKDQSDSWYRAVGLITIVLAFSVIYPLVIWLVYRRTDPEGTLAGKDLIPLRVAFIYGVMISLITSVSAVMTAYQ